MLDFLSNKVLIVAGGCVLLLPALPILGLALIGLIAIIWVGRSIYKSCLTSDSTEKEKA